MFLEEKRADIINVMQRIKFSKGATNAMLSAFDNISSKYPEEFEELILRYKARTDCDYDGILNRVAEMGSEFGIHKYTSDIMVFLCFAEYLKDRYYENNIDEGIFWETIADLRYKTDDWFERSGVYGTNTAKSFFGHFILLRFQFGRLQFELETTKKDYIFNGKLIKAGTKIINTHIPRTGEGLLPEEVAISFERAAEFYKDEFKDSPMYFTCFSWLLYPWNAEILKPDSNMVKFYNNFTIVDVIEDTSYSEVHNLFICGYHGDVEVLPENTTLERAYKERIRQGKPLGSGSGMFEYKK